LLKAQRKQKTKQESEDCMADKYCVFLRGINVNGIKIKMDALKAVFYEMGFLDVRTILATGNVVISVTEGSGHGQELKSSIEKELSEHFNYEAHIILRSNKEIMEIHTAAQSVTVPEGCHNYFLFCDDKELFSELSNLFESMPHAPQEQFLPSIHGAFWVVPKGFTLESEFGSNVLGNKKYKGRLTSRNMNTVEKIYKCILE